MPVRFCALHNVEQISQVVLHRGHVGETVEGADDKKRVAQPAETIVPVAASVGGFGDARRHCGEDGTGILEGTHF